MIKVEKTADNLNDGITNMMEGAKMIISECPHQVVKN